MIIAETDRGYKGEDRLQTVLAVTPDEVQAAARYRRPLAHVAYRIGPESALLRADLLLQTQGGLLCVNDRDSPAVEDPAALCQAVLRECGRRGYQGVLLDLEGPPRPDREPFLRRLEEELSARRLPLYLPEEHALSPTGAVPLVCTALSGGSFRQRLREAADHWGGGRRMALDVQRLRMDFRLPAPTGQGEPLTAEAFRALIQEERPAVFFSPDLCARYFTYTRNGETHFVLFDDAETLRQKLRAGAALGCAAAFFQWPEIRDIAGELLSQR